MRSTTFRKSLLLGLGALAGAFAASGADAAVKITSYTQNKQAITGQINWDVPYSRNDVTDTASIGRFTLSGYDTVTGAALSFESYCVDIFETMRTPATYTVTTLTDYLSSYGSNATAKANQLNALIANGNSGVDDARSSAAMQLAVWEILYEYTSLTSYDLTKGAFDASGRNLTGAMSDANTYLDKVTDKVWKTDSSYTLSVLKADGVQDQLVFTRTSAVPEPASWAMMLAGFGVLGTAMRRRRRRDAQGGLVKLG